MTNLSFNYVFERNDINFNINFETFRDKKILITGYKGSIGIRIYKILRKYTNKITVLDIEQDITILKNFSNIKKTYFDLIFHLAADKRATTGEELPAEVSMQNILSTRNVCRLKFKKIIFASTCKAADPITSYGASKLICERIILNSGGTVVRFVNVFDTSHSVTKIWKKDLNKNSIKVTNCKRYFIKLNEAVNLLLHTSEFDPGRYAVRNLKMINMKTVAKKIYPNKKIKMIPLRFGDRPVEKLVGKYEKKININSNIIKIIDCWGI